MVSTRSQMQKKETVEIAGSKRSPNDKAHQNVEMTEDEDSEHEENKLSSNGSNKSGPKPPEGQTPSDKKSSFLSDPFCILIYVVLPAVICLCGVWYVYYGSVLFSGTNDYDCAKSDFIHEKLKIIRKKFPQQTKNTWTTFAAGIERLFSQEYSEPVGFLIVHNDGDRTVRCLVNEISKFTVNCFNGNASLFTLSGKDLNSETLTKDSGKIIDKYRHEIETKKVMILNNLNDVPVVVAKEFHYFFDVYQPLVKDVAYLFTLSTNIDTTGSDQLIKQVDNHLRQLWGSLDYNHLDPLITRMTTNVIHVRTEEKLKNSC